VLSRPSNSPVAKGVAPVSASDASAGVLATQASGASSAGAECSGPATAGSEYRAQYKVVWNSVYRRLCQCRGMAAASLSDAARAWVRSREPLLSAGRLQLMKLAWPESVATPFMEHLAAGGLSPNGTGGRPRRPPPWFRGRAAIFTWQGDFAPPVPQECMQSLERVVSHLREHEGFNQVRQEHTAVWRAWVDEVRSPLHWGLSWEVCPEAFQRGTLRVHLHAGWRLRQAGGTHVTVERSDRLFLGGVAPNTAAHEARRGRGNETLCVYYCSCDKIGQIVSVSNCVPHKDYAVSPDWAFSLLAAKKYNGYCAPLDHSLRTQRPHEPPQFRRL